MCYPSRHEPPEEWLEAVQEFAWRHRGTLGTVAGVLVVIAAITGTLFHLLTPTDIGRAEADLKRAQDIVFALDKQANAHQAAAQSHHSQAAECRRYAEGGSGTGSVWAERNGALADSHAQLCRSNLERRDNLLHLVAVYVRLVAEAESVTLRAKNARDRGTPYKVAPRVREILAPVLGAD
jgi:hypothetical protein